MEQKTVVFNGDTYIRNPKSRYYFKHTTKNKDREHAKQLHRAVWEFYNGEIPEGCHIHHKDGNIDNNDISNLECLTAQEHLSIHGKKNLQDPESKERNRKQLDEARERASEWHGSAAGLEWHRKHVQESLAKTWEKTERVCEFCGKTFTATRRGRFCSQKCRRRYKVVQAGGEAGEREKKCAWCGKPFITDKSRQVYCCALCRLEAQEDRRRKKQSR